MLNVLSVKTSYEQNNNLTNRQQLIRMLFDHRYSYGFFGTFPDKSLRKKHVRDEHHCILLGLACVIIERSLTFTLFES